MFDQNPVALAVSASVPATSPQLPNDSDRRRILYLDDVYDPDVVSDADASKYLVPRVGELAIDISNKIIYLVTAVADQSAKYKPTLVVWDQIGTTNEYDQAVNILGLPGGFQYDAVLGVDYSVQPPRAVVDGREWAPGAAYAKIYKGDIVGKLGQVISVQYSTGGDIISDQVPVQLAVTDTLTNATVMTCLPCSVSLNAEELPDGSRATVVFFDQAGNPIRGARSLSVQHTALLRDHSLTTRYIDSVELVAPWFTDSAIPNQLNLPLNVALKTTSFQAKINYSNGDEQLINIDGKKCSLLGINEYRPGYVGQKMPLVLTYSLGDNEQAKAADAGAAYQMRTAYTVVAKEVDGAYTPKIYSYPVWNNNGWSLKHFLYDLERAVAIDVTAYVTLNVQSATFNPTSYGVEQTLILNLTLSDIGPQYKPWTHVQYTTFVLYQPASKQGKHWSVSYSVGATPYVGYNVQSTINGNQTVINLASTYPNRDAWLNRVYNLVDPLINTYSENTPPVPNFAELLTLSGSKTRFSLDDWNKNLTLNEVISEGQTIFLKWINVDDSGNELQLGITGVSVSANPTNDDADNGKVDIVPGYVSDADFTLDKTEILAGDTVNASVIVRDIAGKPQPNVSVAFTPSASYPTTVVSGGDGLATAPLTLSVVGSRSIVAATSKGQTKAKNVMVIATNTVIKSGSLTLSKATLKAGVDPLTVSVQVVDVNGTVLPGVTVYFRTIGANTVQKNALTDSTGTAQVTFNPQNAGNDTVMAQIITNSSVQSNVTVTA